MANHKSAVKRDRQSKVRRTRNVAAKSKVKTLVKSVLVAVDGKSNENSVKALNQAVPVLAQAAAKGLIHKKNASRNISRLTRKVNTLSA